MEKDPARAAIQKNRARIFSPGKWAKKPEKIPCDRYGISARAEKQEKDGCRYEVEAILVE